MRLNPQEFCDRELLFYPSQYEPVEIAFTMKTLKEGDVFVDLGSHIGFYSLLAAKRVGNSGGVISVEADPETYQLLLDNIQLNAIHGIKAFNYGVADEEGILTLHRYEGNLASNSFIVADQPNYAPSGSVEVRCVTLSKLLAEANLSRIDFLKMDIEAFEYRVLKRFLAESQNRLLPRFILLEHHPQYEHQAGGSTLSLLESDPRYEELNIPNMVPRNHFFQRQLR
jgi:FkbM family methyltransferase